MASVLIVGGGTVGLSIAVRLGQYGVPVTVVERRSHPSPFAQGRALSVRSMEIYRRWGLEQAVTAAGRSRDELAFFTGTSLIDPSGSRIVTDPSAHPVPSPTHTLLCAPDRLESVLRAEAERLAPGRICFGREVLDVSDTADGMTTTVRDALGTTAEVRTDYVIVTEGPGSVVHTGLGSGMTGPDALSHHLSVVFDADLAGVVADRTSAVYTIRQRGLYGMFLPVDHRRRWMFTVVVDGTDPGLGALGIGDCAALVRAAAGLPGLDVTVVERRVWQAAAQVAERFRHGRVFLAGDGAHVSTPYGGFGLNCGIADADNLAWKLAAVHHGWAGPALLDTYEAERRPVAVATTAESCRRLVDTLEANRTGAPPRPQPSEGLVLGYHYTSTAVLDDGTAPPDTDPVAEYLPSGRPGHRAPHAWLDLPTGRRSTLDLIGAGMTLFLGPDATVAGAFGTPLSTHRLDDAAADLYGLDRAGAALIRPDGHVAWRTATGPTDDAYEALSTLLGRP